MKGVANEDGRNILVDRIGEAPLLPRAEKAGALPKGDREPDTAYRKPVDALRPNQGHSDGGSPGPRP